MLLLLLAWTAACDNSTLDPNNGEVRPDGAPLIISEPQDAAATLGQPVSFSIEYTGIPFPRVQWRMSRGNFDYTDIPGANTAVLNIDEVTLDMIGNQIRAFVQNSRGYVESRQAVLSLRNTGPKIIRHPENLVTICAPEDASFTAAASGSSPYTVQWQEHEDRIGWTDLAGASDETLQLKSPPPSQAIFKKYRAVFRNADGISVTRPGVLHVQSSLRWLSQVLDGEGVPGVSARFSVNVTGSAPQTFEWQISRDNGISWISQHGETGKEFFLRIKSVADDGLKLRVKARNPCGTIISREGTFRIID